MRVQLLCDYYSMQVNLTLLASGDALATDARSCVFLESLPDSHASYYLFKPCLEWAERNW